MSVKIPNGGQQELTEVDREPLNVEFGFLHQQNEKLKQDIVRLENTVDDLWQQKDEFQKRINFLVDMLQKKSLG